MEDRKPTVRVCVSPAMYTLYREENCITVVVDIFRATSAICTAMYNGVKNVIPVAKVEDAQQFQGDEYILAAERGGEIVEGFQYGNSPLLFLNNSSIKDKTLVITTTNGTQAVDLAKKDGDLCVGAFSNFSVLTDWLIEQQKDVMVFCAGWKNRLNVEDTLFAGAVVEKLIENGFQFDIDADAALIAETLYKAAKKDMEGFLKRSSHRQRLKKLNLEKDIAYCLELDTAPVIPFLRNGKLEQL